MPEPPVGGLSRGGTGCTEPSGLVVWGGTVSGEVDVREGEEEEDFSFDVLASKGLSFFGFIA